jgi:hypothetical protein
VSKLKLAIFESSKTEGTLVPTTPSRSGPRNSTAKVSDEWLAAFTKQCEEEPDLYDKERAAKLSQITGIQISRQTICDWCWRLNITRKRKTTEYTDKEKEVNQKRAKKFLEDHHPQTEFIFLLNCASTDEFGVECTKDRMYGVSRVRQSREIPGGKSKYGRSYRPQSTRIPLKKKKHIKFKLSCALSICLAKKCPVLGYQIQNQNFDGQSFTQFVKKRQHCRLVTHDILDRATIHSAKTSKKRKLEESVAQVYEQTKVQRDFYPPGFSHWQPVEKCINYIDSEIACRATEEKQDGEWDKDRLKTVLQEIIENITHEQVKGFYRACFVEMYPEEPIPAYLRPEKRSRL